MRLFLLGTVLLAVSMSGCKKEESPPNAGALRVSLSYATFQPSCLTLTVTDLQDASRMESTAVTVAPGVNSDTRTVAVFGRAGWSRNLRIAASAKERSCSGPVVAEESVEAQVPEVGVADAKLDLRANDVDGDGYVANQGSHPGTDCNDSRPDVYPGAPETCDGIDSNCANGESDAPEAQVFYPDLDEDGYGDPSAATFRACGQPAKAATRAGDCNDADPLVHPDQQELRCDGADDDCDGVADDDPFAVGAACVTVDLGCQGVRQCQSVSAAACVGTEQPVAWYVDADGDGSAGTETAVRCSQPSPNATKVRTDCDDGTTYASSTGTEVCDRLDNDCDGMKDEGLPSCATTPWAEDPGIGTAAAEWNVVAPYGNSNKGWLAGEGDRVVHVNGGTVAGVTSCVGNWRSGWVTNSGRLFIGSDLGKLATVAPGSLISCDQTNGVASTSINGMVGFESGNTVQLYAVDSAGRIIRWQYVEGAVSQAAPVLVTQLAANLRAIHGVSPETLLAVGAEDVGGTLRPVAFQAPAAGGTVWSKQILGSTGTGEFLRAVRVLTPSLAYAAGDGGLLLERSGTTWTAKPTLTVPDIGTVDLRAMVAIGRTAIYVVVSDSRDIFFFDGTGWSSVTVPSQTLKTLEALRPDRIWGAGYGGLLVRWQP